MHQVDLHAAPRRQTHGGFQADVGHEVGRYRQHAFARLETGVDQQRVHRVFRLIRTAWQKLRSPARRLQRRGGVAGGWWLKTGVRRRAAGRDPISFELRGGRRCRRAL